MVKAAERVNDAHPETKWATVDELVNILQNKGHFGEEFLSECERKEKRSYARRWARAQRDDNGNPVWASVVTVGKDGKPVRKYKQETLFDMGDYVQVVEFHRDRASHHRAMADAYKRRGEMRYGKLFD